MKNSDRNKRRNRNARDKRVTLDKTEMAVSIREGDKTDIRHRTLKKKNNRIRSGRYRIVVEQRQGEERGECSKEMGSQ